MTLICTSKLLPLLLNNNVVILNEIGTVWERYQLDLRNASYTKKFFCAKIEIFIKYGVCVLFFIEVFQLKSSGFESLAAAIHITLLALFSTRRNFLSNSEKRGQQV